MSFYCTDITDENAVTYTLQVAQDAEFTRIIVYKENLTLSEIKLTKMEELRPTTGNPPKP